MFDEEIFEEIEVEETFEEIEVEEADIEVEELSEEEIESVEGGASLKPVYKTREFYPTNCYLPFYRVMLTNCPGTAKKVTNTTNVKQAKKVGFTFYIYRKNLGTAKFTVVSQKGHIIYNNKFTVRFK